MAEVHQHRRRTQARFNDGPAGRSPGRPRHAPAPGSGSRLITTHAVGQVVVLAASGWLGDGVESLDLAIRRALGGEPRGVVCDISDTQECGATGALRLLASAGSHPRDWPAVPVAVATSDRAVRTTLRSKPMGQHLMVVESRQLALDAVLRTCAPTVATTTLAPHPTAPRAARDFVSRTLLDWHLGRRIPAASVVISELVTNAMIHAGTDIDVSLAVQDDALRLTVRDRCPTLPRRPAQPLGAHGRGMAIVESLSRSCGVLPTAQGGKAVWSVLNA